MFEGEYNLPILHNPPRLSCKPRLPSMPKHTEAPVDKYGESLVLGNYVQLTDFIPQRQTPLFGRETSTSVLSAPPPLENRPSLEVHHAWKSISTAVHTRNTSHIKNFVTSRLTTQSRHKLCLSPILLSHRNRQWSVSGMFCSRNTTNKFYEGLALRFC